MVSDAEADELIKMVERMKSMAIDIQAEQTRQEETMETLTRSVDTANIRLTEDTQRMKKLM